MNNKYCAMDWECNFSVNRGSNLRVKEENKKCMQHYENRLLPFGI